MEIIIKNITICRKVISSVAAFIFNRLVYCGGADARKKYMAMATCQKYSWVNDKWTYMSGMTQTRSKSNVSNCQRFGMFFKKCAGGLRGLT